MREKFYGIGDLMGYYQFIKFQLGSSPAIVIKKDDRIEKYFNAYAARSAKEDKFALVVDVENCVREYYRQQDGYQMIPIDCLFEIFYFSFCPAMTKYNTYGELALYFHKRIKNGDIIPRSLKYRTNLHRIVRKFKKKTFEYFDAMGIFHTEEVCQP